MDLCEETVSTPGERVRMQWWEKEELGLVGARKTSVATAEADRDWMGWKSDKRKEEESWAGIAVENITYQN